MSWTGLQLIVCSKSFTNLNVPQPIVDESQRLSLECSSDSSAQSVSDDGNVLDLEHLHRVLNHRQQRHVAVNHRVCNVSRGENGTCSNGQTAKHPSSNVPPGSLLVTTDAGARESEQPIHSNSGLCPLDILAKFSFCKRRK